MRRNIKKNLSGWVAKPGLKSQALEYLALWGSGLAEEMNSDPGAKEVHDGRGEKTGRV